MAEYEIWEPLQCKSVFNTYLSLGRSNQKVEESGLAFFWPNWSSSDLPNPNTNTQIHKHTNTQIQHITKCQKDPPCGIFLKRGLFKDVKNDIPMCQKRKYKNTNTQMHKHTNTQIQHITKCQKNPTCGISLKRGLFKDIKNYVPVFLHRIDGISWNNWIPMSGGLTMARARKVHACMHA